MSATRFGLPAEAVSEIGGVLAALFCDYVACIYFYSHYL
jgi:hypothetical protein